MELKFKYWKRVAISDRFSTSVQRSKEHVGTGEGAVQGREPGAGSRGNSGPIITSRGPQRPCDSSNIQTGQPLQGCFLDSLQGPALSTHSTVPLLPAKPVVRASPSRAAPIAQRETQGPQTPEGPSEHSCSPSPLTTQGARPTELLLTSAHTCL